MAGNSREEEGASCSADAHKSSKLDLVECGTEWRTWEQLEPSPPSTSPAWNTEEDEDSGCCVPGTRPSDLYGKFTWKIENFSQISKRELRSNMFEVGGYKWYILVYPQGCDVCNHLSLFLCVADYDKLLPGWSHFVQFTIAVVNKDPKKSKYSDTLHRFCKKEHDWGWKKFMELSKVLDGFTVADTLVIKAQVQVIRENPHHPFRCLDCQYRRELVRVYMTNVEGICRRFVEEKREKIGKLMEDPVRWPSFRSFWSALEDNTKRRLSREKMEIILKAIVKAFFNEKEVTSTLVMDALYSGCKALDYRSRSKKGKANEAEKEEARNPVTWADKEFFVLAGDVLFLLERAANETLPSYKDEKGPQNRTKDGGSGDDFGKDTMERDERRLTELGKRTVEMFVLAHIFSNRVEVAYLEAIALKRQEELIREEEAAGQAEIELKAKREAAEKEKRNKKKQAKQRRNNRKEKEKDGEDKHQAAAQESRQHEDLSRNSRASLSLSKEISATSADMVDDDDDSSVLDNTDGVIGTLRAAAEEDGETEPTFWEREASDLHQAMEASFSGGSSITLAQNGRSNRKHQVLVDDSSSTCSSDSIPSNNVVSAGYGRRRSNVADQNLTSANRARGRISNDKGLPLCVRSGMASSTDANISNGVGRIDADTVIASLKKRVQWLQQRLFEKEEEVILLHERLSLYQHHYGNLPQKEDDHKVIKVTDPGEIQCGLESAVPLSPLTKFEQRLREELQSMETGPAKDTGTLHKSTCSSHGDSASKVHISGATASGTGRQNLSRRSFQKVPAGSLSPESLTRVSNVTENVPVHGLSEGLTPYSTSRPNVCTDSGTEPEMPRPSSAPGVPEAPWGCPPSMQQSAAAPSLARSVSATGRLGVTVMEPTSPSSQLSSQPGPSAIPSVVPSYRNAAAGIVRSSSTATSIISNGGQTCNELYGPSQALRGVREQSYARSLSVTTGQAGVPVVAMGETALYENGKATLVEAGIVRHTTQQAENQRPGMRLTFGTVTPDVLHRQQHNSLTIDGTPTEAKLPSLGQAPFQANHHGGHVEEGQANRDLQNFVQQQLHPGASYGSCNSQGTIPRGQPGEQLSSSSGMVMPEEFPHLDIINELLDDDKMLGLNAFLQQPTATGELQRIYAGRMGLDVALPHGNPAERSGRILHQDTSRLSQENILNGLGKSMQLHPLAHTLLRGLPGGPMDAVPGHYWPSPRSDMPVTSTDVRRGGLDVFVGYPMQSPHLPAVDCPPFSVGQNGYPHYSPMKHP